VNHLLRAVFLVFPTIVLAQSANPSAGAQAAGLPIQKIGPNDVLQIYVYDAPVLSGTVRVSADGAIRLPILKSSIKIAGMLPGEIETAIATALREGHILLDPIVTVTVTEYQGHPINVIGAVHSPLTFQAYGHVTLLDALTRAGGVTEEAGNEVLIIRPRTSGSDPGIFGTRRIRLKTLLDGTDPDANVELEGGEEIHVPEADKIYVVGNVHKPGAFIVRDGTEASVLKMLALSEGLTKYAQKTAYIYRGDAGSQDRKEVPIEMNKILQRKAPDVPLRPNDVLYVPEDGTSHSWGIALNTLLLVGGAGIGSALLLLR
jgi:polysaccharide biosynthesis/export protein